jgi:sec-independent protein translocase protein TatA
MGLDNPIHIAFLLILLLLVFGAKRLPEMGRSLGSGMRGFKDALSGEDMRPAVSGVQQQPAVGAGAVSTPATIVVPGVAPVAAPIATPVTAPVVTPVAAPVVTPVVTPGTEPGAPFAA